MADGANRKGREIITAWQRAVNRARALELQITDARNDERSTAKALASWLAPKDAKVGECFGVWDRDMHDREALFTVQFSSVDDPQITVRYGRG